MRCAQRSKQANESDTAPRLAPGLLERPLLLLRVCQCYRR